MSVSLLSIGWVELLMVATLSVAFVLLRACSRPRHGWLLGVPLCLAIAAVVTPADPVSTLIVAVPYTFGYLLLVRSHRERSRQRA
jgi:Sec-independent protein secretion pathway component TatC